jgi:GTP cyclohydrolase I
MPFQTRMNPTPIAPLISQLLAAVGEDPTREGLVKTPQRFESAMRFMTRGYHQSVTDVVGDAVFTSETDEMVIVKDIELYSLCEHHLLPFFGKCHVAYLPNGKVIGLSKIPRIVDVFARRLQIQETLTQQIATALSDHLRPKGVAVVIEADHLCVKMRGVEKQNSIMITSSMLGIFRADPRTRSEFLDLISKSR